MMQLRRFCLALLAVWAAMGSACRAGYHIDGHIQPPMALTPPPGDRYPFYSLTQPGASGLIRALSSTGGPPVTLDDNNQVVTSMPVVTEFTIKDPAGQNVFGTPSFGTNSSFTYTVPAGADYYMVDAVIRNADNVNPKAPEIHVTFPIICAVHFTTPDDRYKGQWTFDKDLVHDYPIVNGGKGGAYLSTPVAASLGPVNDPFLYPAQFIRWDFQRPPGEQYSKKPTEHYKDGRWYITAHWYKTSDGTEIKEPVGAGGITLKVIGATAPGKNATFGQCKLIAILGGIVGTKTLKTFFQATPAANQVAGFGPGVDHPVAPYETPDPRASYEMQWKSRNLWAPNWFYYYAQSSASFKSLVAPGADYVYDPAIAAAPNLAPGVIEVAETDRPLAWIPDSDPTKPPKRQLSTTKLLCHMGPRSADSWTPPPLSLWATSGVYTGLPTGINAFAHMLRHEFQHAENEVEWFTAPALDPDADAIPDAEEDTWTALSQNDPTLPPAGLGPTLYGYYTLDITKTQKIPLTFDKELHHTNHSTVRRDPNTGAVLQEIVDPDWDPYNDEELLAEAREMKSKTWDRNKLIAEDWAYGGEQWTALLSQGQIKEAPVKMRTPLVAGIATMALLPGYRVLAEGPGTTDTPPITQVAAARRKSSEAMLWARKIEADKSISNAAKVQMFTDALRKELVSPTPTLPEAGPEGGIRSINFSRSIQMTYILSLANLGDVTALDAAITKEKNTAVKDDLMIAMGEVISSKPDPRQRAVYPRLIALAKSTTDAKAKFPYDLVIWSLGLASYYPELRNDVIPVLVSAARDGNAEALQDTARNMTGAGRAASKGLDRWGYLLVRDTKGQLQANLKAQVPPAR